MPAITSQAPLPVQDPIATPRRRNLGKGEIDQFEGLITFEWLRSLGQLQTQVSQGPTRVSSERLAEQAAAIPATDISGGALNAGLYRLSYYARITQAAGVSSSLTITLSFTDGGIPQSFTFAAMTGNTTTTIQSETKVIEADANTPIRYAVAYASAGAPVMKYRLSVSLEQVQVA